MKKLIIAFVGIIISFTLGAQTWKAPIYRITGKPVVKTLKLKPKTKVTIGTLTFESDTLKVDKYFTGSFLGVVGDSLKIKLNEVATHRIYENGTKERKIVPAKNYLINSMPPTEAINVALTDIHILEYIPKTREKISGVEDFVLFSSLAVFLISPFICYNYPDQTFNQDLYQYFALGSTIGMATGFSLQILGSPNRIQFKDGWPEKKSKTWSFKLKTN